MSTITDTEAVASDRALGGMRSRYHLHGMATLWRARITAALGDKSGAAALLRQAFAEGLPHDPLLHTDAVLAGP